MPTVRVAVALLVLALAPSVGAREQPCEPCLELAPRGSVDGELTVGDLILLQRFVVGLDLPSADELRRGDLAPARPDEGSELSGVVPPPFEVIGDGALSVGDVVLGLRRLVELLSFDLPSDLRLVVATPEGACLGRHVTVWGEGLLLGDAIPSVSIDGWPAVVVHASPASERESDLDLITVRENSGRDPETWEPARVDVRVVTPRGEASLEEALELRATCDAAPQILRTEPQQDLIDGTLRLAGLNLACLRDVVFVEELSGLRVPGVIAGVHSDSAVDVLPPRVPPSYFPRWSLLVSSDCGEEWGPTDYRLPVPRLEAPDATVITPPEGPGSGGNLVVLQGTDLEQVVEIRVGPAILGPRDFVIQANGQILIPLMPASPWDPFTSDSVWVSVVGDAGSDPTPLSYHYWGERRPECGTISPDDGPLEGGTSVIVTSSLGSQLDRIEEVRFGGVPGTGLVHPNSSQVAVTAPARAEPGTVDVELFGDGELYSTCPLPFRYR